MLILHGDIIDSFFVKAYMHAALRGYYCRI